MVPEGGPSETSSTDEKRGLRLGGGAIASLTGVGLLLVFIVQNSEDVGLGLGVMRRHRRRKERRDDRRD